VAPTGPLIGLKPVIVGGGSATMKFELLVAVCPLTETVIGPDVASDGTMNVRLAALALVTVAKMPLSSTTSLEATLLKLVPFTVTTVPAGPVAGLKVLMLVGAETVKLLELDPLEPSVPSAVIRPVVAPVGTDTINSPALETAVEVT